MTPTVIHFGETIELARIIAHYRLMSHAEPERAGFWRQMLRMVIGQYREQSAPLQVWKAA